MSLVHYTAEQSAKAKKYGATEQVVPQTLVYFIETARIYYLRGLYQKAEVIYRCLNYLIPGNAAVLTGLGACKQMQNEPDEAIEYYRQSLRLRPNEVCALVNLAECLIYSGHRSVARTLLYRVIELDNTGSAGQRAVRLLKKCNRRVYSWQSKPSQTALLV